jgi:hypothetical protein
LHLPQLWIQDWFYVNPGPMIRQGWRYLSRYLATEAESFEDSWREHRLHRHLVCCCWPGALIQSDDYRPHLSPESAHPVYLDRCESVPKRAHASSDDPASTHVVVLRLSHRSGLKEREVAMGETSRPGDAGGIMISSKAVSGEFATPGQFHGSHDTARLNRAELQRLPAATSNCYLDSGLERRGFRRHELRRGTRARREHICELFCVPRSDDREPNSSAQLSEGSRIDHSVE